MEVKGYKEEGSLTCIICGTPVQGREKVKYQGWWCHAECAAKSLNENVDNFDRRYFWLGSLGAPVGILLVAGLYMLSLSYTLILNPWALATPLLGMAVGLGFQTFGFYGIYTVFKDTHGQRLALLAIVSAICHFSVAAITLAYGFDPIYYDSQGVLLPTLIPGYIYVLSLAYISLAALMLYTAIVVVMFEGTLGSGLFNRILAVIFIGLIAMIFSTPISIFVEMIMVTILFMSADVPKQWREVSPDE
ncbi:MAG: hypothetical protein P1Q69_12665 [Candidatus Thorarchaeota archaeon]|nr:hypothetical protein [Candidatus Thorarchaeota archaeon]